MSAGVARILREVADLIEPPGRWTKGSFARDEHQLEVSEFSPCAVCWCVLGAVRRLTNESNELRWGAQDAIAAGVATVEGNKTAISWWNDSQSAVAPIVAVLRAAADKAEQA